jgi:hypothetical protein
VIGSLTVDQVEELLGTTLDELQVKSAIRVYDLVAMSLNNAAPASEISELGPWAGPPVDGETMPAGPVRRITREMLLLLDEVVEFSGLALADGRITARAVDRITDLGMPCSVNRKIASGKGQLPQLPQLKIQM